MSDLILAALQREIEEKKAYIENVIDKNPLVKEYQRAESEYSRNKYKEDYHVDNVKKMVEDEIKKIETKIMAIIQKIDYMETNIKAELVKIARFKQTLINSIGDLHSIPDAEL